MEYGIPGMKLDKGVVERKISALRAQGVQFRLGVDVGVTQSAQELTDAYDAVVLCVGTGTPRSVAPEGSAGIREIVSAVDYLTAATRAWLEEGNELDSWFQAAGKDVVIVGGDTGNDCIGTALRQKCRSVTQLEMLPRLVGKPVIHDPIPQRPREQKQDSSQLECLNVFCKAPQIYQTTVKRVHRDESGALCAVTLIHLEPRTGAQGRMEMVEVPGTERTIPCGMLLVAAGFLGPEAYLAQAFGIETDERSIFKCSDYATTAEKVFACGDCRTGQSLVVKAMVDGRRCAQAVHRFLCGG